MSTEISASLWWFWLTIITAVAVSCYETDTQNSQQYMMSLFVKLSIMCTSAVFYYVISQSLCKRSQSSNTHRVIPSQAQSRDPSHIYLTLLPQRSLKWIQKPHLQFLHSYSQNIGHYGAYTVLRTVHKYYLFQFNMHLNRLLATLQQYTTNINIPQNILRRMLIVKLRNGLDEFYDDHVTKTSEARILIYIDCSKLLTLFHGKRTINDTQMEQYLEQVLYIHFGGLSDIKEPISACIRIGRHIFSDSVKTSKWADDRKQFRKEIDVDLGLNEVIMTEIHANEGFVMEGLSSNFAVLCKDLSVVTASIDDGIFNGSLRGFLVNIMKEIKENNNRNEVEDKYGVIPNRIVFDKPLFADIMQWKSVMIMSTSRLLIPIDTLYIDIEDEMLLKLVDNDRNHAVFTLEKSKDANCGYRKISFARNDCLENMRVFLKQHMKSHSVYIGSVFNQRSY